MRKLLPYLLGALFFAFLIPRLLQSIAQSDVYPEWSTLRSDPPGAKVLYEALRSYSALEVERNFEPWENLRPRKALYVVLGAPPTELRNRAEYEKLLNGEGTVLLALRRPASRTAFRTEQLGFIQNVDGDAPAVLELKTKDWTCRIGERDDCRLARRATPRGTLLVLADGTSLQNGALHDRRDSALLVQIFSSGLPIVFDETHLGVRDSGGVGVLLRRHRLFLAIAMLALLAILFVWRNSTSLMPEREPLPPELLPQPAASLRTLLEQNVSRAKLLETLAAEWQRALPLLPGWQAGRKEELESALERAKAVKDIRAGYGELQAAVRLRKGLE